MKIALTGGGTGGHVIPNIALIDELISRDFSISYIGSSHSIEERLIPPLGIDFYHVTAVKLRRDKFFQNLKIPYLLLKGIHEARGILRDGHFDVIYSKGGYVSLPVAIAGYLEKIPVITHESDRSLGISNKLISRFASLVITSSDNVKCKAKTINLGTPIREKIFNGDRSIPLIDMRYDKTKPFLLFIGGSSGAKAINDFVYQNIDELSSSYNILHITGKGNNHLTHENYKGVEYAENIEDYLALADIIVSRSGANAVAEITALKKKCILIPLSSKASRGDQWENARNANKNNQAVICSEDCLDMDTFLNCIKKTENINMYADSYDRNTPHLIVNSIVNVIERDRINKGKPTKNKDTIYIEKTDNIEPSKDNIVIEKIEK